MSCQDNSGRSGRAFYEDRSRHGGNSTPSSSKESSRHGGEHELLATSRDFCSTPPLRLTTWGSLGASCRIVDLLGATLLHKQKTLFHAALCGPVATADDNIGVSTAASTLRRQHTAGNGEQRAPGRDWAAGVCVGAAGRTRERSRSRALGRPGKHCACWNPACAPRYAGACQSNTIACFMFKVTMEHPVMLATRLRQGHLRDHFCRVVAYFM